MNKLTFTDKQYIDKYYLEKPPAEISLYLDKPAKLISEYIRKQYPQKSILTDRPICEELRGLPEWEIIKSQFTPDELILYEQSYLHMKEQFKSDVLTTERKQIFQAIELEIFMHQNKMLRRRATDACTRVEEEIQEQKDKDTDEIDRDRLDFLFEQLDGLRGSLVSTTKDYNDLLDRHSRITMRLYGSRDQRLDQATDTKETFPDLVKRLLNKEFREKEAKQAELIRLSTEHHLKELGKNHKFVDNSIDRVILTKETLEMD